MLSLILLLIGPECGARFLNKSYIVVRQNETKRKITFDIQLQTALNRIHRLRMIRKKLVSPCLFQTLFQCS